MDLDKARALVRIERQRTEQRLEEAFAASQDDRAAANEPGDMTDPAEWLTAAGTDDAVVSALRDRLAALERAEERLDAGTYGQSLRSGAPIPDERLEADPAAELTREEAEERL